MKKTRKPTKPTKRKDFRPVGQAQAMLEKIHLADYVTDQAKGKIFRVSDKELGQWN